MTTLQATTVEMPVNLGIQFKIPSTISKGKQVISVLRIYLFHVTRVKFTGFYRQTKIGLKLSNNKSFE